MYGQLLGTRVALARYTICKIYIGYISITIYEDEEEKKTHSSQHFWLPRRWVVSRQLFRTPTEIILDGTTYATIQRSLWARRVNAIQWQNTALRQNKTKLQRNEVPKIRRCCAVKAPSSQPNNQTPEWHCSFRRRKSKQDPAPACSVRSSLGCKAHLQHRKKSFSWVLWDTALTSWIHESSARQEDPQEARKVASP